MLGELCGQKERDAPVVVLVPNLGIDLLQTLDETVGLMVAVLKVPTQDLVVRRKAGEYLRSSDSTELRQHLRQNPSGCKIAGA
jgi:hypothetical protein